MKCLIALAIAVSGFASQASAGNRCDVPVADWQPRNVLAAKLEGDGWQVRSIRTEDGCYEAFAINAKGENVAAFFNPKSFELVDAQVQR